MPRWTRFLAAALTGAAVALGGLVLLVYLRSDDRNQFWASLLEWLATPLGRGTIWLFVGLMGAIVLCIRLAVWAGWPAPVGAMLSGLAVPAGFVLWLLSRWAQGTVALLLLLRLAWADLILFCLPFLVAAPFAGWLWDRLP